VATPLPAQKPSTGVQVFPADYFAASRPADAYDMIRKIPGFELVDVDEDVRGFSGSRGNVLFDGRVPSGKQESLEQMLRRVPASSVLRIELIRGGSSGTATGNFELVANVVRRSSASNSASYLAGISASDQAGVKPDARIETSNQWANSRFEAAIALETDIDDESGRGTLTEVEAVGGIEREDRDEREVQRTLSADAEYKTSLGGGELVGNFSLARERTSERVEAHVEDSSEIELEHEKLWSGEVGAQYNSKLGPGEIEGRLVQRMGWLRSRANEGNETFEEKTRTRESIGRIEYRNGGERLSLYGSVEGAVNSLDSSANLTGAGVPISISGSDVEVVERRAEVAIGATWKVTSSLLVEPSLRTEVSNIRARGDSPSNECFLFLKPRTRLTWNRGETRVQATVEREAAQLDFQDFVASADLDRDDVLAGARALRPPTTWALSGTVEQSFWGDGSLSVTLRHEWIDDVIDRVVIFQDGELFAAIGNIGKGKRRILKAEMTAPFERFGLPGLQLRASLTFLKSRVTDPVMGEKRIISEDKPFEGALRVIHDLPGGRWNWGADASLTEREREFRHDEVRDERVYTALGAFIEFRPTANWRMRAEVQNLTSRAIVEERRNFDGLRSEDLLDSTEVRRIETAPTIALSVRKSFGSNVD
jgi:hypothetical protein